MPQFPIEPNALVRARTSVGDFSLTVSHRRHLPARRRRHVRRRAQDALAETHLAPTPTTRSCSASTPSSSAPVSTPSSSKPASATSRPAEDARDLPESGAAAPVLRGRRRLDPDEVDIVINTHLHFDHCGWNTTLHPDGSVTPTFPNARYFAHAGEVAHGHLQLDRDRVSYLSPNYDPLIDSGQMTLLDLRRRRRDGGDLPRHLGRTVSRPHGAA